MSLDTSYLPFQHNPGALTIYLLNQCNLSCMHCYMDAVPSPEKILPKDLILRSLSEVEQLGIGAVNLTGGEPLLYPDLAEILQYLSGKQSYEVTISTNGTLIDRSKVDLLRDSGVKVNVSLDGPANYHDKFRGMDGAFSRASRGIELMQSEDIQVSLVTTINKNNLIHLPWLAEWASRRGIGRIFVQPLMELGRGSLIADKKLSQSQIYDLYFLVSDLANKYRSKGLSFNIAYRSRDFLLEHPCAAYVCNGSKCHRKVTKEIKTLIVREDGTVLPEIETLNPRFSLGKLSDGTLVELVKEYFKSNYQDFDQLCRLVYNKAVSNSDSPFILLDEIISMESWMVQPQDITPSPNLGV